MFTRSRSTTFYFLRISQLPHFISDPNPFAVRGARGPSSLSSVRKKRLHLAHRQDDLPSSKLFSTKRPKRCLSTLTHAVGVTWLASIEMFVNASLNLAQIHTYTGAHTRLHTLSTNIVGMHTILILATGSWYTCTGYGFLINVYSNFLEALLQKEIYFINNAWRFV